MIASSKRSPPMRAELAYTTPLRDSTATSEVPPPMSSTIEPRASCTGRPAPTAAAIGSLPNANVRAPAPFGGFADRAALDLGRAEGHTHQYPRGGLERAVAVHLVDEELQHLLGVGE